MVASSVKEAEEWIEILQWKLVPTLSTLSVSPLLTTSCVCTNVGKALVHYFNLINVMLLIHLLIDITQDAT